MGGLFFGASAHLPFRIIIQPDTFTKMLRTKGEQTSILFATNICFFRNGVGLKWMCVRLVPTPPYHHTDHD